MASGGSTGTVVVGSTGVLAGGSSVLGHGVLEDGVSGFVETGGSVGTVAPGGSGAVGTVLSGVDGWGGADVTDGSDGVVSEGAGGTSSRLVGTPVGVSTTLVDWIGSGVPVDTGDDVASFTPRFMSLRPGSATATAAPLLDEVASNGSVHHWLVRVGRGVAGEAEGWSG